MVRQTFVLRDQNFPPVLPCNTGECLKIIRLENGSLAELACFLELTRGKSIQAGSVIMLFSTAHLQMRGYRIHSVFKGGVVCIPGVPILLGGCDGPFVVRSILESGNWLRYLSVPILRDTWGVVSREIASLGKGGHFFTEKFRHVMPQSLNDCLSVCSWVSGGWTSPCGVQPSTPESEQRIVFIGLIWARTRSWTDWSLVPTPVSQRGHWS